MRIFRVVAIVVGALVALVVIGLVALLLFVDPNRYRGDIERVAKEHTARVLVIRGKLQLKVFPWLALSVHDVQLSNPAGFGAQPFMTVQTASIGVKLLPLLGKRLEVSRIALDGVNLNLVSRGAENNWKDLSEPKGPAEAPSSAASAPGTLTIEGLDLTKSSFVYRDEVKKSTSEIGNLELHTGRLQTGPDRTVVGSVDLQGSYLARSAGQQASAEAKPLAFSLRTAGLTLDRAAQTVAPAKIEVKLGDSQLVVSIAGEKMNSGQVLTGTVAVPLTSARKLLQSLGIAPPVTRDSGALSAFGLTTNFRLSGSKLQLTALQLTLDDTRAQGTAAIEDLATSALSFDLNVNGINVDRYRAPVDKTTAHRGKPNPPSPKTPPAPLPLETLRKLDVHGSLRVGSATFSNVVFTDVVMPLVAKDGHIRLGPTQARLYGGSYNGDIVLDARPVQAQLSLNQHVKGTDLSALMKAALDSTRISGRADVNVAVTGQGNTDDALLRSLNGKIDANVKQGALIGIDIAYELQRANALLKRQLPPQRTGAARTAFNTLEANGTLDKSVLRIDDLQIATDFLKVHGRGTLDTVTEAINYQLVTSVNKLPANGIPAAGHDAGVGLDALRSVDVPLTITGTLSSPTVRPDIEALAKGKLGQEVQQKAGDLVKKKLGDKLKDLFGH
ncbi:MAG: AsmA family protein [Steroidobacteraceae bacterium]